MPKQELVIREFQGGLNTDLNDKDLDIKQFSALKGFNLDSLGGIKMIGRLETHQSISANADSTTLFDAGNGLFAFNSDKDDVGEESSNNLLALSNGDYINIWDSVGSEWNGMSNLNDEPQDSTAGFSLCNARDGIDNASVNNLNHIYSFIAPEGSLRVCDGNFGDTDNTAYVNSTSKILKYIDKKK